MEFDKGIEISIETKTALTRQNKESTTVKLSVMMHARYGDDILSRAEKMLTRRNNEVVTLKSLRIESTGINRVCRYTIHAQSIKRYVVVC